MKLTILICIAIMTSVAVVLTPTPAVAFGRRGGTTKKWPVSDNLLSHVEVQPDPREHIYAYEEENIHKIWKTFESIVRDDLENGSHGGRGRAAHIKSHGCMTARLVMHDDIPSEYQTPLFKPNNEYDVYMRFSNGAGPGFQPIKKSVDPFFQKDKVPQNRAIAIKILNAPEQAYVPWKSGATTQDFMFDTNEQSFMRDIRETSCDFFSAVHSGFIKFGGYLATHISVASRIVKLALDGKMDSPLTTKMWANNVFKHGTTRVAKYALIPCETNTPGHRATEPTYVGDLKEGISRQDNCWFFGVQLSDEDEQSTDYPVEPDADGYTTWPGTGTATQFRHVATLTIPQQRYSHDWGTPAHNAICERLTFNTWHTSEAHRPLGWIERVRRVVYANVQYQRQVAKGYTHDEPTDITEFQRGPHCCNVGSINGEAARPCELCCAAKTKICSMKR